MSPVEALREPWSRGCLGDGKVGRRVIAAPLNTGIVIPLVVNERIGHSEKAERGP